MPRPEDTIIEENDATALAYGPAASWSFQTAILLWPIPWPVIAWLLKLERIRDRLREVLDQLGRVVEPGTLHGGTHGLLAPILEEKRAWLEKNMDALAVALAAIGADFGGGPNPLADDIGPLLDAFGDCRASPKALMTQIKKKKKDQNEAERNRRVADGTPPAEADAEKEAADKATDSALNDLVKGAPSWGGKPADNR